VVVLDRAAVTQFLIERIGRERASWVAYDLPEDAETVDDERVAAVLLGLGIEPRELREHLDSAS
jgi:hypothetical protein